MDDPFLLIAEYSAKSASRGLTPEQAYLKGYKDGMAMIRHLNREAAKAWHKAPALAGRSRAKQSLRRRTEPKASGVGQRPGAKRRGTPNKKS